MITVLAAIIAVSELKRIAQTDKIRQHANTFRQGYKDRRHQPVLINEMTMAEERNVWVGTPSQVINLSTFIVCGILFFLVIPLFIMLWKWLVVKTTKYEMTTERLRTRRGVFNKYTDELELYRVRDYQLEQPFFLRMFSLGNIVLETSDRSHPQFIIRAIPNAEEVLNQLREHVEECRTKKQVREVDFE